MGRIGPPHKPTFHRPGWGKGEGIGLITTQFRQFIEGGNRHLEPARLQLYTFFRSTKAEKQMVSPFPPKSIPQWNFVMCRVDRIYKFIWFPHVWHRPKCGFDEFDTIAATWRIDLSLGNICWLTRVKHCPLWSLIRLTRWSTPANNHCWVE